MAEKPTVDANKAVSQGDGPPSRRMVLTKAAVVAAALSLIEDEGLVNLTMRRLGSALDVEAMSLYRYVAGREVLLDCVVAAIIDELEADEDVIEAPGHGWQDFLQRLAHGIRKIALAHPQAFPLVASRPAEAPWLRPPLRSLKWVELFLGGLISEGFNEGGATRAYRAFTSFLLGHLLLEVAMRGADLGPLDVIDEEAEFAESDYPLVARLRDKLTEDHSVIEFEEALEGLLHELELARTS